NDRPSYCLVTADQFFTSGAISRSIAATIATLYFSITSRLCGVAIGAKPIHGPLQCRIYRNSLPTNLPLGFGGGHKHFLFTHAHGIDSCASFFAHDPPSKHFIYDTSCQRHNIGDFNCRRRQPSDRSQLVENLLERQIFPAENIALSAFPFFESLN